MSVEITTYTQDDIPPTAEMMLWANMNLPPQDILTHGEARLARMLSEINDGDDLYQGVEATPTRLMGALALIGWFDRQEHCQEIGENDSVIQRVHQTWPTFSVRKMLRDYINRGAYIIMPGAHSLSTIGRMGRGLGVPIIVFADQRDKRGRPRDFTLLRQVTGQTIQTQLGPELGEVDNYGELAITLASQGVDEVVIDTNKAQQHADNQTFKLDWQAVLQAVRTYGMTIGGLHIAAGREDNKTPNDKVRSREELAAILESAQAIGQTALGAIVREVYRMRRARGYEGLPLTTIEIPRMGLVPHTPEQTIGRGTFIEMHQRAGNNLKNFVQSLPDAA